MLLFLPVALLAILPVQPNRGPKIVRAAERFLGQPYVFGGRAGRPGCRSGDARVRCSSGIDCQSLIFFAFERVTKRHWTRYSVMPSVSVRRQEFGVPIAGLDGALRSELDPRKLRAGDVLFFLLEDYNLDVDPPLWRAEGKAYGTWHTGLVHRLEDGQAYVIHAKPGDQVTIEPLRSVAFDALFAVRPR